jgi:IclR family transcriptional regulator, acetate operon repressor
MTLAKPQKEGALMASPGARQGDDRRGDDTTGNRATVRVLMILSAFLDGSDSPDGSLGVTEISRKLGMTKSMVHRGLTSLTRHQYVVRVAGGSRYLLGPAVAQFGTVQVRLPDLHKLCRPVEESLFGLTGETVSIHVPVDDVVVCVDGIEGGGPVARWVPLGRSIPLHVSPASRAVLAHLPEDEVENYVNRPLKIFTENTLHTREQLWDEIHRVRAEGYARSLGDHYPKETGAAIGFPILDVNDEPHGAIVVAGPTNRFTAARIEALMAEMITEVAQLNRSTRLYLSNREPVAPWTGR